MKIMIMTDMEGSAGVQNFEDWVEPGSRYYETGRRLLTEEVNAAVDGLSAGGATEIRVVDGHGGGAVNVELLDKRATLLGRPPPNPVWPWTLDKTFQGLCFVGQHAKAGTDYSHMTHTGTCDTIDLRINDISVGEFGEMVFCALELGVPVILACGEEAFCCEAEALTPGVETVAVKRGLASAPELRRSFPLGPSSDPLDPMDPEERDRVQGQLRGHQDGLDSLSTEDYRKAKLAAIHLAPQRARQLIRSGACRAVKRLKENPAAFHFPEIHPPYVRTARFRKSGDNPPWEIRDEHPDSLIALMNMSYAKVTRPDC